MAKKTKEPERVWVVVSSEGHISHYATLFDAQSYAKDYLDVNETVDDVYIFEVVKSWYVEFPPEPSAEVYEMGLGGLP